MSNTTLIEYLKSDVYRIHGKATLGLILKTRRKDHHYRQLFWFRISKHLKEHNKKLLFFFVRNIYKKVSRKNGIELPLTVSIGYGCRIYHGLGLMVNTKTKFGNNVTLIHNLTFADEKGRAPIVGDRVRFTPGAVIVGGVTIGSGSVVGANCVVTKDVPENDIAVGIPNRNLGKTYEDTVDRNYWKPVKN